ncbi:hypothetical protein RJ639_044440 [Escallonia herrerae]|uniref:PI31 proteasome regulator N-terminal domain-containing protein n=1 Tax=Escallonia herrerae TaxID=1293975 RepID=A0AA88WFJ5_9ASTE|nr:hypothetical protein RJ639_044440 [Escallonia herrerae]
MPTEKCVMEVIKACSPTHEVETAHDKVAFAVHATFLAAGYVLRATGPTAEDDAAIEDHYVLAYTTTQKGSPGEVTLKCRILYDKLIVSASADCKIIPLRLTIDVGDYVADGGKKDGARNDYESMYKSFKKLVNMVDIQLLTMMRINFSQLTEKGIETSRYIQEMRKPSRKGTRLIWTTSKTQSEALTIVECLY